MHPAIAGSPRPTFISFAKSKKLPEIVGIHILPDGFWFTEVISGKIIVVGPTLRAASVAFDGTVAAVNFIVTLDLSSGGMRSFPAFVRGGALPRSLRLARKLAAAARDAARDALLASSPVGGSA